MREIKFRGKQVDNGEWVYGVPVVTSISGVYMVSTKAKSKGGKGGIVVRDVVVQHEVDPETVGQFTGLKDKNGTEIYEGDAVCYHAFALYDYRGIVRFGEYEQDGSGGEYAQSKCIGFFIERTAWIPQEWQDLEDEAFCLPEYEKTISLLEVEEIEIIGNIHDNPELLGGAGVTIIFRELVSTKISRVERRKKYEYANLGRKRNRNRLQEGERSKWGRRRMF